MRNSKGEEVRFERRNGRLVAITTKKKKLRKDWPMGRGSKDMRNLL